MRQSRQVEVQQQGRWLLVQFLYMMVVISMAEALSSPSPKIVVITHAAGRMGKLLAGQIHEDPDLSYDKIRAIVGSEAEAMAVRCDLGGMTMTGGVVKPIPCAWLETVVATSPETLELAFADASAAVLCDAAHNELVWLCDSEEDDNCSFQVRVPAQDEQIKLSSQLLEEIDAASKSTTLERVILRSSMGLGSSSDDVLQAMGGDVALRGLRQAEARMEEALKETSYVILRLGALTDDPGMVPLVFGINDSLAETRLKENGGRCPPILSRADAARVSVSLLKTWFGPFHSTFDCAWMPKFEQNSVGTEEAFLAASRQNLAADILEACRSQQQASVFL